MPIEFFRHLRQLKDSTGADQFAVDDPPSAQTPDEIALSRWFAQAQREAARIAPKTPFTPESR